jgi:hypothetical protein
MQPFPDLLLRAVLQGSDPFLVSAMGAAKEGAGDLDAVPDDRAIAMLAMGRQGMDGAFEAIEVMRVAVDDDLDGFVIFISADFTAHHKFSLQVL